MFAEKNAIPLEPSRVSIENEWSAEGGCSEETCEGEVSLEENEAKDEESALQPTVIQVGLGCLKA